MARTIQVHQIDAFTRVKFTGNPAVVDWTVMLFVPLPSKTSMPEIELAV